MFYSLLEEIFETSITRNINGKINFDNREENISLIYYEPNIVLALHKYLVDIDCINLKSKVDDAIIQNSFDKKIKDKFIL